MLDIPIVFSNFATDKMLKKATINDGSYGTENVVLDLGCHFAVVDAVCGKRTDAQADVLAQTVTSPSREKAAASAV